MMMKDEEYLFRLELQQGDTSAGASYIESNAVSDKSNMQYNKTNLCLY